MNSEVLDYIKKADEKLRTAKVLLGLGRYEDAVEIILLRSECGKSYLVL